MQTSSAQQSRLSWVRSSWRFVPPSSRADRASVLRQCKLLFGREERNSCSTEDSSQAQPCLCFRSRSSIPPPGRNAITPPQRYSSVARNFPPDKVAPASTASLYHAPSTLRQHRQFSSDKLVSSLCYFLFNSSFFSKVSLSESPACETIAILQPSRNTFPGRTDIRRRKHVQTCSGTTTKPPTPLRIVSEPIQFLRLDLKKRSFSPSGLRG